MSRLPRSCSCGQIVRPGQQCSCKAKLRGSTTQRGYGAAWQKLSAQVIAEEFMCRDCGHPGSKDNPLTCDHIIAKANGGTDERANLCCRCRLHNSSKGTKTTDTSPSLHATTTAPRAPRELLIG